MSGRTPACEDSAAITARIAELRAERMRALAGSQPQPEPPSQMALVLEAMQRARARLRQAGVPIREEAAVRAAERYVEHIERAITAKMKRRPVPAGASICFAH